MHLQSGSLRVKAGEHVRRGQVLARVGGSGDAREPHLHFEVTDSPKLIAGEGLPYVIERYRSMSAGGEPRTRELPMNNNLIEFPGSHEEARKHIKNASNILCDTRQAAPLHQVGESPENYVSC